MMIYKLHVSPGEEDCAGELHDEFFMSSRAARRRRAELGRDYAHDGDSSRHPDLRIERIELPSPSVALVLDILNRQESAISRVAVAPSWPDNMRKKHD